MEDVHDEHRAEHRGVEQVDVVQDHDLHRPNGRDEEEAEIGAARSRQRHALLLRPVVPKKDDGRPADADQQPVRAGHVRDGQSTAVRSLAHGDAGPVLHAGLPREDEVDGVLGKNRDQREERDREAFRDIQLGHLGSPRHQEGGAQDRDAEQQRLERWSLVNGAEDAEAHECRRQREQRGTCDESPLLSRVSQLVGRPFVRHGAQPYQRPASPQPLSGAGVGAAR